MDADIYPHHCAPDDVAALVQRLESLAGVSARVIKYLSGHDWRHGA